ncbi:AAA family ATPase [Vibrio lentus]
MALQFRVQGLGKIEDAEVNISPLTVITGPNGTGKSFFTKSIYSIFRMLEESSPISQISKIAEQARRTFADGSIEVNTDELSDLEKDSYDSLIDIMFNFKNSINNAVIEDTETIAKLNDIFCLAFEKFQVIYPELKSHDDVWEKKMDTPFKDIGLERSISFLKMMLLFLSDTNYTYGYLIRQSLPEELKENFQVNSLSELISMDQDTVNIELKNHFILSFDAENFGFHSEMKTTEFFRKKPKSIFFESPAYWRVRDALVDAKMKSGDEYLSGVPKYFFDLDSDLRKKSKTESELIDIYDDIKSEISGEFIFEGQDISFKDAVYEKNISKNLVSFGMTNLGMLNALIKNNVIKKGSYVFIDEPETNLHPDWQVLMIQSLVLLSKAGVNVIITTHSTEILKYIEVTFSKIKAEEGEDTVKELLSINYLDTDGTSLKFDSECPIEQTKEALSELSSPFFNLYMEGN